MSKVVLIETPYSGDIEGNIAFCRKCMLDSWKKKEIPIATHLLWTNFHGDFVADDDKDNTVMGREWALQCGDMLRHKKTDLVVFYIDKGWSSGMKHAMEQCLRRNIPREIRYLDPNHPSAYRLKDIPWVNVPQCYYDLYNEADQVRLPEPEPETKTTSGSSSSESSCTNTTSGSSSL